jgi:hypothetical protein
MSCEYCIDADGIPCFPAFGIHPQARPGAVKSTFWCPHCLSAEPEVTHSLLRTNPILAAPEVSDPASRSQVYA